MVDARQGASQLIALLGDDDTFSLLPFSSRFRFAAQGLIMKDGRARAQGTINGLFADGGTAL